MRTEKFWGLVWDKARKRIVSREFENRQIYYWLGLGVLIYVVLKSIPGIDFWFELLLLFIPPTLKIIFSFVYDFLFVVPKDIYKEKIDEINKLNKKYLTPDLSFNVLMLGEAYKNGERYASVVVVNNEKFPIESFMGIIVGVEIENPSGNNADIINFINPGGRPVMIDGEDKNSINLLPSGGKARFNISKGDGNNIHFLNDNNIRNVEYADSMKVTVKFSGVANGSYISPILKSYRLSCAYRDMEKKTGIYLVGFTNY